MYLESTYMYVSINHHYGYSSPTDQANTYTGRRPNQDSDPLCIGVQYIVLPW